MTILSAPGILSRHRDALEDALRLAIGDDGSQLVAAARYVMGWEDEAGRPARTGGKRIRPALCLFAAEAFGADIQDAMPGAVAVELVHNFSLVHDEIQDHDMERHHRPTTYARFGAAQAINVGDFIYTRAVAALTGGPGDAGRRLAALAVLNHAIERMIAGQWDDLAFESREQVTVGEYLDMVAGKTGALLAAPLEIGAILAGASAEESAIVGRWGAHVGAAFQSHDDYLGLWGDPEVTGKSNRNDITRRKKTLPIVHGMNDAQAGPIIRAVYGAPTIDPNDVQRVIEALEGARASEACRERAREQANEADRLLAGLALDDERRMQFRAIARYLVEREA
ncbi:MAG: polyprenyl synthetase family protein [Dehalococcoidia bacterium]|nr:polyprenyl synthetase family protein [Dehalococcoidia bacterium]